MTLRTPLTHQSMVTHTETLTHPYCMCVHCVVVSGTLIRCGALLKWGHITSHQGHDHTHTAHMEHQHIQL